MDSRSNINPFSLVDKTILITGASSGLGRAISIACANHGANLLLVSRKMDKLEETKSLINTDTICHLFSADLSNSDSVNNLFDQIKKLSVRIHGFVHSAGISATLPLKNSSSDKWQEIYQVNVVAGMQIASFISNRQIISSNGGSFVFISSIMGTVGESGKSMYSASKAALNGAARSLSIELAARKIRVNTISPGMIETDMVINSFYRQNSEVYEIMKLQYPLGLGSTDDVANSTVFLLSDASRWITGINLTVDGGFTAK